MMRGKSILAAFAAMFVGLTLTTGCAIVGLDVMDRNDIYPKGEMKTVEYNVGSYEEIQINEDMEVIYRNQASDVVKVEIAENMAEQLEVKTEGKKLVVRAKKRASFHFEDKDKIPKLYISTPELKAIEIEGMVVMKDADPLKTDTLSISTTGMGDLELELDVNSLKVDMTGMGKIIGRGRADTVNIEHEGDGNVDFEELISKDAEVQIYGIGRVRINCADTLNISGDGLGSVGYKGNPRLTTDDQVTIDIKQIAD